jgi:hypothetical protein
MAIILVPVAYVLGSAAVETWNDPGKTIDLAVDGNLSPQEQEKALQLMQAFTEHCPSLFGRYIDHIQNPTLTLQNDTLYRGENYGWTEEAVLAMKINDESRVAAGHTVRYFISRTGKAGWVTNKSVGAQLCQKEGNPMAHTFVPF